MLTAAWALAGATILLALTSLIAVITWRENRRREHEDQQTVKILDAARKEFSDKKEMNDLKSGLIGIAVLAAAVFGLIKLEKWGSGRNVHE